MIYKGFSSLVGGTPLYEAENFKNNQGIKSTVLTKLECFNPAGSVKDRVAVNMLKKATEKGLISEGATVIEPTSGNTGIGLAAACVSMGYKAILVMPDTMSVERQKLLKAYGAEIVLTEGAKGMLGSIEKAKELKESTPNSLIPSQFENPDNPEAHTLTTGPEIWADTEGKVDIFIACIGTGGTVSGTARYLKEKNPDIKVIGVEPYESPLITKGVAGPHGIQGIGANFIPENVDMTVIDEVVTVKTEDAKEMCRAFAKTEGLLVGISSGAALMAAKEIAKENEGKTIVAILPDSGERYMSVGLYD
ncbi:MAG: cysteine synthase A [Acutalibacteraceae bacterium]|nr:cysteine synthase A [Acutalibacteraceae bacterium]